MSARRLEKLIRRRGHELEQCDTETHFLTPCWASGESLVLEEAMSTLRDREREALWLHDGLGLTCEEVAKMVEAPSGTVMAWLFRARRKIRLYLKESCN